ncbi:RagB/SusD family nutrient uptake outer membrane protein [Pedobacter sp. MC2016-14]|uniref:RagB/SusD family nutrient uptake outer membrane protein n=1 Tax=Pedobacter sp. MC2016-14 TaxID=2897327 RepID=UPI001E616CC7|nr:RagB/SusD family nutrient uptake outer membrane protein [Pedobacter sp. MC2016-14]MCD0488633.1 RagB/SusD family nutrient uptake outer membrane protein [Pedobacter sp. MC2016-14]
MKFHTSYLKITTLLIIICLVNNACKKLVEIPDNPANRVADALVFTDSANVMSAMAGVYNGIGASSGNPSFLSGAMTAATGLSSDELNTTQGWDEGAVQLQNNNILADNYTVSDLWNGAYGTEKLYIVNACLQGINGSTGISASLKKQLLAELKMVRALYYFTLVNLYGGVPLVTSIDYKLTRTLPRASVDQVYAQIFSDLLDAERDISIDYPSSGRARPNTYVVKALLAKVYLYRKEWRKAADLATEVIGSGHYSLVPIDNIFLTGSNEAIWQLPAISLITSQTAEARAFLAYPYAPGQLPSYQVTDALLNAFEIGDPRKEKWLNLTRIQTGATTFEDIYAPYKYKNWDTKASTIEDYMMLRMGEQYLIRAEALAQLNLVGDAVDDINELRERARGTTTALPAYSRTISKADCLEAVAKERRIELMCEWGNRWFDLKRTGEAVTVLTTLKPDFEDNDLLYPIPRTQIQLNPFLIQNLGYK